jgi:membrane protein implicated in regulation of membrane protease activity
MPLDKFVLILVAVIAAAGATIWLGTLVVATVEVPLGWMAVIPTALVAYVVWRVIAERIRNSDDDHYDRMDK